MSHSKVHLHSCTQTHKYRVNPDTPPRACSHPLLLTPSLHQVSNTTKGWVTGGQRPSYYSTEPCLTLPSSWEEVPRACGCLPSPFPGWGSEGRAGVVAESRLGRGQTIPSNLTSDPARGPRTRCFHCPWSAAAPLRRPQSMSLGEEGKNTAEESHLYRTGHLSHYYYNIL